MSGRALEHRAAIITGANQGLGLAIAMKYVEAGASVCLCARNETLLQREEQRLRPLLHAGQQLLVLPADVSKAEDVKQVVSTSLQTFGQLDVLINNAAIHGPKGPVEDVDWTEWVRAVEINLLGSVLMCRAVLPHFRAQGRGKIVQLSGGGATSPMPRISAYAASKAAVVRFIETLAEEVKGTGIEANSVAPGALNTRLLEDVLLAGPEKVGQTVYARALKQKQDGGASLDRAAELVVFLGSAQSDGITGKLISAVWDPWKSLPEYLNDLRDTDIYTLRRIVPRDRGKTWEDNE
jgi:NAD(P)-dependent dehydrogenase (short-subunit alcohol dehydrogenase family)